MWLARQASLANREAAADITSGRVSIAGGAPAVELAGEQRELELASPGGYFWKPKAEQQALVLRTDDGGRLAAGILSEAPEDLEPGEVRLVSAGGAEIRLGNDGSVQITGTLYINGKKYPPETSAAG